MKWPSINIGPNFDKLLAQLTKGIDTFVTTKEEKERLKLEAEKAVFQQQLAMQQQLTDRHAADMKSDSWLSKNIRPLVLIACFALVTIFAVADGNIGGFEVKVSYVKMIESTLSLAVIFYFGGRSVEKGVKMFQDRKEREQSKNQSNG